MALRSAVKIVRDPNLPGKNGANFPATTARILQKAPDPCHSTRAYHSMIVEKKY